VSWWPWATRTCGSTARARKAGSQPGCPWRAETNSPDDEVDGEFSRIDAYYAAGRGLRSTRGRAECAEKAYDSDDLREFAASAGYIAHIKVNPRRKGGTEG
jgi:hypothetical protein